MNKQNLNRTFSIIKAETDMDYAVINTDMYGDCNTCVSYSLCEHYGGESTGIYVKKWLKGMNKSCSWEDETSVYIAHDITKEQAKKMIEILQINGYIVTPELYDSSVCFEIRER